MNFDQELRRLQRAIPSVIRSFLRHEFRMLPTFRNPVLRLEQKLARDMCLAPGKRIRPLLTLLAYRAVGGTNERAVLLPAIAFELFHNYTLVQDDVYDEDVLRRGRPTNHAVLARQFQSPRSPNHRATMLYRDHAARFAVVAGFLNGEYLHNLSALAIMQSPIPLDQKLKGLELHARTSLADNTGQILDLDLETHRRPRPEDFLHVVSQNTNGLFAAAAEWGAILGNGTRSQRVALRRYASELGYVYKMKDDLLDIGVGGAKGRAIGSDVRKGKRTILVIHALRAALPHERRFLERTLGNEKASAEDIRCVIRLLYTLGSVAYVEQSAKRRVATALTFLRAARPAFMEGTRTLFEELARYMFERPR